jgi:hypothetical protein
VAGTVSTQSGVEVTFGQSAFVVMSSGIGATGA